MQALKPQIDNSIPNCKDPIIMLNMQYRMVGAISHWPNKYFYEGKMIDKTNYKNSLPFKPYIVMNLDGLQDDVEFLNIIEAEFVGNLINCIMYSGRRTNWDEKVTIGVITGYQSQKTVILSKIKKS